MDPLLFVENHVTTLLQQLQLESLADSGSEISLYVGL